MSRTQFSYYIELFDPKKYTIDEETFENNYEVVSSRDSGIQLQLPIFEHNLTKRKNWYKLTKKQAMLVDRIDFCLSNLPQMQTKSIVNNRIFLDVDHFISDKSFFYKKFKLNSFCPTHMTIEEAMKSDKNNEFFTSPLILKSGNGFSSYGIKVLNSYSEKSIYDHIESWKNFKNWTISTVYVPKLWNNIVTTNRIYYLVTKQRINSNIIVNGYWYDEFISYRAKTEFNGFDSDNFIESFITNFDDTPTPIDFFYNRTLSHGEYAKIFTQDEYNKVKKLLTQHLEVITKEIFEHITCANDYEENYNDENNRNVTFHLYGLDTIITDNLDIKIIEINGCPTLRDFDEEVFNYKRMLDEILKLTTDELYKPSMDIKYMYDAKYGYFKNSTSESKFCDMKFIKCGEYTKKLKLPVYFTRAIYDTYPFIINGFFDENRLKKYQRVKNPSSSQMQLFYGQRDLYIRDQSSESYYDELLEWNKSKSGKNARVLNKIQGITYFLASKDRMYTQIEEFDFVPKSILFDLNQNSSDLQTFIKKTKDENPDEYFIIKPIFGSQGKGISILNSKDINTFINKMKKAESSFGYNRFIVSKYIKNPKLYNNKKFNLRFYALICIKKLPTFSDKNSDVKYYILKDCQIYFSALPYNTQMENVSDEINKITIDKNLDDDRSSEISIAELQQLVHMTNLQIVKNISEKLDTKISLNEFVDTLDNLNYSDSYIYDVKKQAQNIINKTITSIKHNMRPLNRFVKNSSAFNLIAYDVMLDDNNKLHLIEINRGPDLHGLKITLGLEKITNIFSEIFDITIDNKTESLKYFDQYEVVY